MASRLRRFLKFPRRAKKTKESTPPNGESQFPAWKRGTKVIGLFRFEAEEDEDLSFDRGEVLVIEDHPFKNGWFEARNSRDVIGFIPCNYVTEKFPEWKRGTKVIGLFNFTAEDDCELSFDRSEVLVIEDHPLKNGWFEARNSRDVIGFIPCNYVTEIKVINNVILLSQVNTNRSVREKVNCARVEEVYIYMFAPWESDLYFQYTCISKSQI